MKRRYSRDRNGSHRMVLLALLIITMLLLSGKAKCQTLDSVRSYIATTDLKHKGVVLRQSILETGWYGSYSCRVRHNLFGFRYNHKYLEFDSWQKSIDYYVWFQAKRYKGGDYYEWLTELGYAADLLYVEKLKNIKL